MSQQIQIRRDTTANWTFVDPILASGEFALDTTTDVLKLGNGVNKWSELPTFGTHDMTTVDTTNGLSISGQEISLQAADSTHNGALTSTDWSAFNGKLSAAAQTKRVAISGGDYTSIQAAIDSILDASITTPYVIEVNAGTYVEDVVLKDWVFISGTDPNACLLISAVAPITGTLSAGAKSGVDGLVIIHQPNSAANLNAIDVSGDFLLSRLVIDIEVGASFNGELNGIRASSLSVNNVGLISMNLRATTGTITEFCGYKFQGAQTLSFYQSSLYATIATTTGVFKGCCLSNTGDLSGRELAMILTSYNPAFSGTITGYNCGTVATSPSNVRYVQASSAILRGAGTGTAYGTALDSSGASAQLRFDTLSLHIDGFANEYTSYTGTTDSQRLQITSVNKDIEVVAAGLSVVTPFDANSSGFVRWGGAGSYWSYDAGTKEFTILRPGAGIVHSAAMTWVANQTVVLTDLAANYVYMDSLGIIRAAVSASKDLYIAGVVLFEVWSDGTRYLVTKENHPYEFATAVSHFAHKTFGPLITGLGATITLLGAVANRQLQILGDDTVIDHGLESTITSAPDVAATFNIVYTNTAGKMIQDGAALTTFLSRWNDAGVASNANSGRRVVLRLGVLKDSLNSSAPIYVGCLHTATYGTNSSALSAVSNGNIVAFPAELKALEVVQLGFLVINSAGAGAGSIITGGVVVAKQAFGASLIGASSAAQASLITTATTNFDGPLSGADTTVQAALETLDDNIKPYKAALSWSGSGPYTMTITGATHGKGLFPDVRVRSTTAGVSTDLVPTSIAVTDSSGDVLITHSSNPAGYVQIRY